MRIKELKAPVIGWRDGGMVVFKYAFYVERHPFDLVSSDKEYEQLITWCGENFDDGALWIEHSAFGLSLRIHFRYEHDAILFKLKWM